MSPVPLITNVLLATQSTEATPYCAKVRLPVVAVPAHRNVTDPPCVMVWLEALLLNIVIMSPVLNIPEGIVTPPVVIDMCLPVSVAINV